MMGAAGNDLTRKRFLLSRGYQKKFLIIVNIIKKSKSGDYLSTNLWRKIMVQFKTIQNWIKGI